MRPVPVGPPRSQPQCNTNRREGRRERQREREKTEREGEERKSKDPFVHPSTHPSIHPSQLPSCQLAFYACELERTPYPSSPPSNGSVGWRSAQLCSLLLPITHLLTNTSTAQPREHRPTSPYRKPSSLCILRGAKSLQHPVSRYTASALLCTSSSVRGREVTCLPRTFPRPREENPGSLHSELSSALGYFSPLITTRLSAH